MRAGGTSVDEPKSRAWLAFLIVAPVVGYVVHRVGGACGWNYGALGGACRAVILLSILAGTVTGALAAVAARRASRDLGWKGYAVGTAVVLMFGILAARAFEDYRRGGAGIEMDESLCRFARQTLPDCVEARWGHDDAQTVRDAQPDCYGDAHSIQRYAECSKLADCQQIIDCVAR